MELFSDPDYRGPRQTAERDIYDLSDSTVGNDEISSVRVPRGCRVTLYEHSDYRGSSVTLYEDTANLRDTRLGEDRASSVRVDCH